MTTLRRHLSSLEQLLVFGAIALFLGILSFFEFYQFEAWGQVTLMYSYNAPFADLIDHPHFYRYLITYPGLWVADYLGYSLFSVYITFFVIGTGFIIYKIFKDLDRKYLFYALILIMPYHALMNGRGALSWFGWVLAIFIIRLPYTKKFGAWEGVLVGLSLLTASVSSGTFAVTFSALIIGALHRLWLTKDVKLGLTLAIVIILFSNYFIISFTKNIEFYEYGSENVVVNMLDHGLGGMLSQSWAILIVLMIIFVLAPLLLNFLFRHIGFREMIVLAAPTMGGLFGFTTLTLVVPAYVILLLIFLGERSDYRRRFFDNREATLRRQVVAA